MTVQGLTHLETWVLVIGVVTAALVGFAVGGSTPARFPTRTRDGLGPSSGRAPGGYRAGMKLTFLLGAAVGYTLGARAGRERYEQIVSAASKLRSSQTVQSTAGVVQAQVDELVGKVREAVAGNSHDPAPTGVNGYHR